ncbi:meiosis-specific protein ASY2-like isoform X1 [Raphanus sativus]|uniref:Meiosis-specific protein ASY2-like isoform X1 n=1 Tax=Raphanus sativus TaxID=3726 RepID=A0A9W3CRG6_RAPSA|nr:meiosis-specific protein ASY2-like isoform X1 [Raphanus sativus]XP_056853988.1 meiosis-specific protein ASY2-like isoform X1 [Raphanus sativus]XP_056856347.1 meiosis-specific protein ASY2-like isoform X1 [Raphanus sativus]XP_056858862.1 meiosis-specific protein ASY2-like isoform X1 [Raphanus sativus]XP_056865348.1 meiosis-specific protein ASY2-like isoform X1 [Raphanus sativus]
MSTSKQLSREQKGKMISSTTGPDSDLERVRGSGDSVEEAHREAMMDTENMTREQRMLVSVAMVQSRADDDGGDGSPDDGMTPYCFYPGNIFEEQRRLDPSRARPPVVEGQDWRNVLPTRSTFESVTKLLKRGKATGVTFIIPSKTQRPWSPPKGYQCVYESYFEKDTKLWFPIPRLVTAYTMRRGVALSQFLNGAWRLAVALMVIGAEAGAALSVRAFEELVSVKINRGLLSLKIRPNYNVVTGYPTKTNDWQRSYFYVKSDRSAFEEPLKTGYRVLWNNEFGIECSLIFYCFRLLTISFSLVLTVPHSNTAEYEEDFLESARIIASQKQDFWENFSYRRIRRSIDRIKRQVWRSDTVPLITKKSKRINLFTKAEQIEINRARAMRELPDLSLVVGKQLGFVEPDQSSNANSSDPGEPRATESDGAQLVRKSGSKRKEREGVSSEEKQAEETSTGGGAGSEKKRARKDPVEVRPSSVERGELQALEPSNNSRDDVLPDPSLDGGLQGTSSKVKKKSKKNNKKSAGESSGHEIAPNTEKETVEAPTTAVSLPKAAVREDARGSNRSSPKAQEGKAVPKNLQGFCPDKVDFIFKRDTPLVCNERDCARFVRQVRGSREHLPLVKDLVFQDEYTAAAGSSVKVSIVSASHSFLVFLLIWSSYPNSFFDVLQSQGDWNEVVRIYDKELKRTYGVIDRQRRNTKEATVALEVMLKKKDEAVIAEAAMRDELSQKEAAMNKELKRARELVKALEKEKTKLANEKKTLEEEKAAAALEHSKEMDRLRESRRYEVTHERIRVMAAMHGKAAVRFQRIQDRESRRDNFEDARCMLGQARGMRRCLEGMKAAGKNISQGDIDIYAGQERHYDAEVKRLIVDDLLEKDLSLSPLVLESRFVIQEMMDKIDKFGSNMDLLDSEAAKTLRTPLRAPGDRSEEPSKSLLDTVQSPARPDAVLPGQEVALKDPSVAEETNKSAPDEPISNTPVNISDSPSFEDADSGASEGHLEGADSGASEEHPEEDLPALD